MVRDPSVPVIDRSVKVATPLALVVAARSTERSTARRNRGGNRNARLITLLPDTSCNRTTGCCEKATPFRADDDGWVAIATCVETAARG